MFFAGLAVLLPMFSTGLAFEAKDFYKELISFDQDLGHADMTYLYCNPFKDNEIYLEKSLSADVYSDGTAKAVPDITAKEFNMNYSRPVYEPSAAKNGTVKAKTSGYEEGFRPVTAKDMLKPGECAKVMHRTTGEPRYGNIGEVDVVPVTELTKVDAEEKALEQGATASVSMEAWEWWSIVFQNRTWIWVNNSNSYDFSALPVELNVTLVEAASDGHDIRMACGNAEVPFAYKAYGSQKFGLRFHAKLEINSINKSCYAYYNPTLGVANASANWNKMYWNLWFNATENYWDWQDLLQYETNWYAAVAPAGVGGASNTVASSQFVITAPTNTRPNPTFTGINIPNRAFIHIWSLDNDTSQQSGTIFGEADAAQAPYTSYQVTAQRQTGTTGRIILREFTTGGSGTIIASNSTTNKYYSGYVHTDIFWTPNSAIRVRTHYLNGTLMQVLNFTDVSIAQGLLGFNEEAGAYYHALGYRQFARNGVSVKAKGNDSSLSEIISGNASAQNIDIEWGAPSMQYCGNGSVWQMWSVDINGDNFVKTKEYPCQYGCWDGKCRASGTEEFVMLIAAVIGLFAAGALALWLTKRI